MQGSRATPLTFRRLREESRSGKLGESLELGDMCENASASPHAQLWGVAPTCGVPGGVRGKTNDFQVKVNLMEGTGQRTALRVEENVRGRLHI